jgi:phospholipid-translocating ATPase
MTDIIKTSERSNLNKKLKKRDMQCIARDFITALALCHNVTPSYPDPNDLTKREYQASSPDEIALVSFADKMGMKLLDRDANKIVIQNSAGQLEEY